tara:strand:+ start:774 stop:1187 length:414 start_codon:yes stop_codon:yes gene_type:complete
MTIFANIITSGVFFIMLFFSLSIARNVHSTLGPDNAGKLLRVLFPKYFFWGLILSLVGAVAFYLSGELLKSLTLMIVSVLAGVSRFILVPKINKSRDLVLDGEEAAKKSFSSLHTISVSINVIQLAILLVVLIASVS